MSTGITSQRPTSIEHPRSEKPTANRRRVLLVSYCFPPVGGAGVQRPVKFAKYLREFGWDVSVLTAANPSVPVFDESLCRDIPDDVVITRARTLEPDYRFKGSSGQMPAEHRPTLTRRLKRMARSCVATALQPDAQILWAPAAFRAGRRLLRETRHDVILATAPPHSNLLLASRLKRATGLPLMLDFRDEWDLSSRYLENSRRDRWSTWLQKRLQRRVLRSADTVIATTQASTNRLEQRIREASGTANTACIYNGFDPPDFQHVSHERASTGTFRLVYTGTLWNLTDVSPVVAAIEQLAKRNSAAIRNLECVFVGRKTPEQQQVLDRLQPLPCRVKCQDYCDHAQALTQMASADALCLLLSDVDGADRVAPAKLFEYLGIGREMLAVVPEGETAGIVRRFLPDSHIEPRDIDGISRWVEDRCLNPAIAHEYSPEQSLLTEFTRRHQSGQLAELLEGLVTNAK